MLRLLDDARRSENIANRKKAAIALSSRRVTQAAPISHAPPAARPLALRPNQTTAFKGPSSSAAPPAYGARSSSYLLPLQEAQGIH